MAASTSDLKYAAKSDVVCTPMEKGALLVDLGTGDCWELNRVGAALWNKLAAGETLDQAAKEIHTTYEVEPAIVQADGVRLCESLVGAGLLSPAR
jgi:hypothetical protein